jgi:hypothetical protein
MSLHNNLGSLVGLAFYIKLEYNSGRSMWECYLENCTSNCLEGSGERAYEALEALTKQFINFEMDNQ